MKFGYDAVAEAKLLLGIGGPTTGRLWLEMIVEHGKSSIFPLSDGAIIIRNVST